MSEQNLPAVAGPVDAVVGPEHAWTSEQIQQRLNELAVTRDGVLGQVETAKRAFASGQGPANRDWLARAEHKIRATRREITRLTELKSKVAARERAERKAQNDAERAARHSSFEVQYVLHAHRMLPAHLHEAIRDAAVAALCSGDLAQPARPAEPAVERPQDLAGWVGSKLRAAFAGGTA